MSNAYLKWLTENTETAWWTDTADYSTMDEAIANGAVGCTTNPVIVCKGINSDPDFWRPYLKSAEGLTGDEKTIEIIRCVTVKIAEKFLPIYEATNGAHGYVCAQVNPKKQGDSEAMIEMGRRLASWAPNVAVKIPGTAAGLRALEELTAEGITTVGTVSFTAPQAVAIAAAQQRGLERCRAAGKKPGAVFSVIMVGRLDDYLRDIAKDMQLDIPESALTSAGTAAIKKAYRECKARGYEAKLMPAAMRGTYHATLLSGSNMTFSLAGNIIAALENEKDFAPHIDEDVAAEAIEQLNKIPEFVRAYNFEALPEAEFIRFGATQRTLSQFVEMGWSSIANFKL
ncbi:MAG: transaldolase family protein [Oscillospiraceae bacterium]|nr:transaldolase family protein [Oscillospiraceae bacterium]MBQ9938392.1 transaldolase family protein [Oscillospiraceae bacterium]